MKQPDLEVIDRAIRYIERGDRKYTCYALYTAAHRIHGSGSGSEFAGLYVNQYRRYTQKRTGSLPVWWNSQFRYKKQRVQALRDFRQACIDAAKKGKRS